MNNNDVYDRQRNLNLEIPSHVTILGVGGIGSWIGLEFAIVGVPSFTLWDPDRVELSNLNRTPYKIAHVGRLKVGALAELIWERRPSARIEMRAEMWQETIPLKGIVIDCRDAFPTGKALIKLSYDGYMCQIHVSPSPIVFGEGETRYRITPSFVVPPVLLASLTVQWICTGQLKNKKEQIVQFDVRDLLHLLTGGVK